MIRSIISLFLFVIVSVCFSACSQKVDYSFPKSEQELDNEKYGSLTKGKGVFSFKAGETKSGFDFAGSKSPTSDAHASSINKYLWRASLNVVSSMPIIVSDAIGGVISTDWVEFKESELGGDGDTGRSNVKASQHSSKAERMKMTIIILSANLKPESLKVSLFKQVLDKSGHWVDAAVSHDTIMAVENRILFLAKSLSLGNFVS